MTGDPELLRRYAEEGSEEAFAELVRRHLDFVYAVALRHARSPHRAEEAAQAVFTALARKARVLAGRTELVGWLFVSARYAALKIVRAEALRETREREAGVMQREDRTAARALDWRELQPLLDDALRQLGERDRSAVLLHCVKGLTFAEVGASLDLSGEAARKRIERALDRVRRSLDRRGLASTSAAVGAALAGQSDVVAPAGLAAAICAGAASAGGKMSPLAVALHLMSTSKITAAAALAVGVLAIGSAVHETQAELIAQGGLAAARADAEGLQRPLALARERSQADETETARLASLRRAAGNTGSADADAETGRMTGRAGAAPPAAAAADPAKAAALRQAGLEYLRAGGHLAILSAGKLLKHPLTPAQIDGIVDIEAADFNVTVNGVQIPGNPPEDEIKGMKAIAHLIGIPAAREMGAMHQASPYWTMTADVAGNLAADEPLDPAAGAQLTAILRQNQVAAQPESWPAALGAAAQVLSPSQEAVLRTYASSKTGISYSPEGAR